MFARAVKQVAQPGPAVGQRGPHWRGEPGRTRTGGQQSLGLAVSRHGFVGRVDSLQQGARWRSGCGRSRRWSRHRPCGWAASSLRAARTARCAASASSLRPTLSVRSASSKFAAASARREAKSVSLAQQGPQLAVEVAADFRSRSRSSLNWFCLIRKSSLTPV